MNLALPLPEDEWSRDVAPVLAGWPVASVLSVVLLFTVVTWAFV